MPQESEEQQRQALTIAKIALPPKQRGLLVGKTGSGKSTLAEKLVLEFLKQNPQARILILDSKPRFRAEWEITGIKASWRYRKWAYGAPLPGSFLLPLSSPASYYSELKAVWKLGGHIAIAQVEHKAEWWKLTGALDTFYEKWGAKAPRLAYVDEVADFFDTSAAAKFGDAILRVIRSGRERNVAMLGGSQRPRGIPKSFLTEVSRLFLFELDFEQDIDHLKECGLPQDVKMPRDVGVFYLLDKIQRRNPISRKYYQLDLGEAA